MDDMHRFERLSAAKRRTAGNSERIVAAESLISLAARGNGSDYCKPFSGIGTMTDTSMVGIRAMETERRNLVEQNEALSQECARLRKENLQLTADHVYRVGMSVKS